jgi:multidrug efflux pump subunit AcrB
LATSIAGGLTFATLLTLFFTPSLIKLGERYQIGRVYDKKEGA